MSVRKALIGGGAVLTGIIVAPYFNINLPNPFRTPGVQNIEDRYTARGGSPHGTPAVASKLGDTEQVEGGADPKTKAKGVGTPFWEENYADQKSPPGRFKKNWNEAHYGTENGK